MLSRRSMLAGLVAGAALPQRGWAAAGGPAFVAAARGVDGAFALVGLDDTGRIVFRIPLPGRAHAAAAHPNLAKAVVFARRPGTFALVIDCVDGSVSHRLDTPAGHHFYGHGVFVHDGAMLVTTENHIDSGQGQLGLWDVTDGYTRIGAVDSGGIGPHEVIRLPGTNTLAVANGGIRTHPDSDRDKLNLSTMRPNLSYIRDGRIAETVELPPDLHQASLRHLSAAPDGAVAFGLQWNGADGYDGPLVGLHQGGEEKPLLFAADHAIAQGYIGSVAMSANGRSIAATAPRGARALICDLQGEVTDIHHRFDVCGVAASIGGFVFSDGNGGIEGPDFARFHDLNWDNHLVRIG